MLSEARFLRAMRSKEHLHTCPSLAHLSAPKNNSNGNHRLRRARRERPSFSTVLAPITNAHELDR
jgi:hypothetical protein